MSDLSFYVKSGAFDFGPFESAGEAFEWAEWQRKRIHDDDKLGTIQWQYTIAELRKPNRGWE